MITLLLLIITLGSFLFFGVVGEDKTWLYGPAYVFSLAIITLALIKNASSLGRQKSEGADPQRLIANSQQPIASVLWILFIIYGVMMISKATVPFESKLEVLMLGSVVGAYIVWGRELTTFRDNRVVLGLLILVVMILALYGLIIHFKCPEAILWSERYAVYEGRLMSTYICPNHFAHLMQMLMPFCLALLFIPQTGIFLRLLAGYTFMVFLPPLFLTESRAGWLGTIAATGVVLCLMALRRSKKIFAGLVILVPVCSALLLFGAWRYSETFQRRMTPVVEFLKQQGEEGVGAESKDFRPQTWMDTIDMIREAPLFGFGPGNYRYTYPEHRKRFRGTRIVTGHPHNEYLELIADYGLIGFGLFALAWCTLLIRILIASLKTEETRHAFIGFVFLGTAAGTMVHSFFDFQMHVYPNALVFALLAAMAWGPLMSAKRKARSALKSEKSLKALKTEEALKADGLTQGNRDRRGGGRTQESGSIPADTSQTDLPTTDCKLPTSNRKLATASAWFLAIGFLSLTILCIQTMSSAFIRAMGDKAASVKNLDKTEQYYRLAYRIDPLNWRAAKGMGNLLFNRRYYSLDSVEKVEFAEEERIWFERAYVDNPKDAELVLGYGKCLIFLARSAIGNEPLAVGSISNSSDDRGSRAEGRGEEAEGGMPVSSNFKLQTSNQLQDRGLELLREACRYRPFNDLYWWNLGVELRKAERYEEALEIFRATERIHRTASTRKNIQWIQERLKAAEDGASPQQPATDNQQLYVPDGQQNGDRKPAGLPDLDEEMPVDPGLKDLLDKMED